MAFVADPSRADQADQARYYDTAAREHFAQRRWEAALEDFFAAQALAPSANLSYNIAVCFEQLGKNRAAYTYYSESLEGDQLDANLRVTAKAALARLASKVARVQVQSTPPGARIYIDDAAHGDYGVTPRDLAVDPGEHRIWVELDGYQVAEGKVAAKRGQVAKVALEPKQIVGTLVVTGRLPSGVEVERVTVRVLTQDGTLAAEGMLPFSQTLPEGNYRVHVEAAELQPWSRSTYLKANAQADVVAQLTLRPKPTGDISAVSTLSGSVVELDGVKLGTAPLVIPNVVVGNHTLKVLGPGASPVQAELTVAERQRTWATASFKVKQRSSPVTWWVGGAGVAALAVGTGLLLESDARFERGDLSGESLQNAGGALLIGGAAAVVGAVVLYFVTGEQVPQNGQLEFSIGDP
jgi:hypothetical protein